MVGQQSQIPLLTRNGDGKGESTVLPKSVGGEEDERTSLHATTQTGKRDKVGRVLHGPIRPGIGCHVRSPSTRTRATYIRGAKTGP